MLLRPICCNRLLLLLLLLPSLLLHYVNAEEGKLICYKEDKRDKKLTVTKTFALSDARSKNRVKNECRGTPKLTLEGASILTLEGLENVESFVIWLFGVKELEMCVAIENTVVMEELPIGTRSIKGTCKGPLLRIVNNTNLYLVIFHDELVDNLVSVPNAVRIRGNRKLEEEYLKDLEKQIERANGNWDWDLQPLGECILPTPFTSFEILDRNCTNFYGPLMLEQGITEIQYDPSKIHKFNLEGCIQIEKTELKDLTFLKAFSRFRPMQSCAQFIRNNKKLCSKNLNYLNMIFKDIQFSNNGDKFCSECIGGQVSKYFLEESFNCSLIFGDLIIANFRGLPSNFGNLRSIETIEGRLVIVNNTGLHKFDYLSSLRSVGRSTKEGAAIIVKDNADLTLLVLPNLLNIRLNEMDESMEIVNNPVLSEHIGQVPAASTTTSEANTSMTRSEKSKTVPNENREHGSVTMGEQSPHSDRTGHRTIISGGAAAALIFILMCTLARFFVCRQKTNILRLPQPSQELNAKSQEKLLSLCLEILERSPAIWFMEDFNLLWKRSPYGAREFVPSSSRHAEFVKSSMIPTANNGYISRRKEDSCQKHRAKELLRYDLVIIIGNTNNVREVVYSLPCDSGDLSTYTDEKSIAYKLLQVRHFSSKLTSYRYEAKDIDKNAVKNIEILLYQWSSERLPTDFTELLQLAAVTKGRKAICTSNRRKEVFSMLCFLHACVIGERLPESVVEAFHLHSRFCNGAPLDRFEMLYLMRMLIHWGSCARCIPKKSREEYAQWCQTYDCMADFSRKHRSIMNIHPLHLGSLDGSALMKAVEAVRRKAVNLSDRPYVPARDSFRKKTSEEIKRGANEAMKNTCRSEVQCIGITSGTEGESSNVSTSQITEQTTSSSASAAMTSQKQK